MSAAFLPSGRTIHKVKLQTAAGQWVKRTTGTRDAVIAKQMQAMVTTLQAKRERDLVDAIIDGSRLTVARAFDAWRAVPRTRDERGRLREPSVDLRVDAVRALLNVTDLRALLPAFRASLATEEDAAKPTRGRRRKKVAPDTADHYAHAVRATFAWLLGRDDEDLDAAGDVPVTPALFTQAGLQDAFDAMNDLWSGSTVRKRGAGVRRFVKFARVRGALDYNPMLEVELPPAGKPRTHYLATAEAIALADAQPAPFREFAALLAGSGIEVSVALALTRRDVDVKNREIRAAGTKTHNRDRVVRVADWAWPYVERVVEGRLPGARLFPEIRDRYVAGDAHRAAAAALVAQGQGIFEGYTMRDHRHSYAVRAMRAGAPPEVIARQLGHVDAVLVLKVYGVFAPKQAERDHWERIAAAQDAAITHAEG